MPKSMIRRTLPVANDYAQLSSDLCELLRLARQKAAQSINSVLVSSYWEVGRRIVTFEQKGRDRALYGDALLKKLGDDLTGRLGRGFGWRNVYQMRQFYLAHPLHETLQTPSAISRRRPRRPDSTMITKALPLTWSHYVRLLQVRDAAAVTFYETEALRGGWSVRQLDRQIDSQFYERTALSRNKATMLTKGSQAKPEDRMTPEDHIKDPYVLEFLGLKDEYSESELEEALILRLEPRQPWTIKTIKNCKKLIRTEKTIKKSE